MLVTFNSKTTRKRDNQIQEENRRKRAKIKPDPVEYAPKSNGSSDTTEEGGLSSTKSTQNTSFKVISNTQDFFSSKSTNRSKKGCLICKYRKKKCDEGRPTCSDCARLHKTCIWIDDNMTDEEIRLLKEKVEAEESRQKLRKRNSKSSASDATELKSSTSEAENAVPNNIMNSEPRKDAFSQAPSDPEDLLNPFRYSPTASNSTPPKPTQQDSPISQLISLSEVHNNQEALNNAHFNDHLIQKSSNLLASHDSQDEGQPKTSASHSSLLDMLRDLTRNEHHDHSPLTQLKGSEDVNNNFTSVTNLQLLDLNQLFTGSPPDLNGQFLLHSPLNSPDIIPNLNSILTPLPPPPPSYLPELASAKHAYLYNYYEETLSKKISIAPSSQNDSNSFQKVFLPLAHKDKGVLYGILAWAAFHLGDEWEAEGVKYVNLALQHLMKTLTELKSNISSSDPFHTTDPDKDRQTTIVKLATLLILCGAEICKGDVKNWSIFLNWGWKILYAHGGILNFNRSKEEHWLISNFAYHDLLSSFPTEHGTYFPSKDYEIIFRDSAGYSRGNLNPLLGVSKKLYGMMGDIKVLLFNSKRTLKEFYSENTPGGDNFSSEPIIHSSIHQSLEDPSLDDEYGSPTSEHGRINRSLSSIIERAHVLDQEIQLARPEPEDLQNITGEELEWQLTLFEAFQLSTRLLLKQSVLKCNPSMLEMQIINSDLMKCIDVLLETPVQASLVFPLFISGIHCVAPHHRLLISSRMSYLMKTYGSWNIQRAKYLVERVWQENPSGDKAVDWHSILESLGWDINFA